MAGSLRGMICSDFYSHEFVVALTDLQRRLMSDQSSLIASGRNRSMRLNLTVSGDQIYMLVKSFGQQSFLKDWLDLRFRKSKAQRSFEAAEMLTSNAVATPVPIAFVESRKGSRLVESYYLSQFLQDSVNLQQALLTLLHEGGTGSEFMDLLGVVAKECRRMHDAGFMHYDLGNQNILLREHKRRNWIMAGIIDLNRGRILDQLSLAQRARDLSRLNIPSNLMLMFLDLYWGAPAASEFMNAFSRHRQHFRLRESTRVLRHPIREYRLAQQAKTVPCEELSPAPRNIWIWDDTSDQALAALDRKERVRLYPPNRSFSILTDTLVVAPKVWAEYRRLKSQLFTERRSLQDRFALALDPDEDSLDQELELLQYLGDLPVLVRFYHHQDREQQAWRARLVQRLCAAGHGVTIAFVQDRCAIVNPSFWQSFVLGVLKETHNSIEAIEFGHAINRVKWGLWSFGELDDFYAPLEVIARTYPQLNIIGPATIDFEYPFLISVLKRWPESVSLGAMSHHLYVDRRGAPENMQGGFGALEKFAMARAVASHVGPGTDRVIVSEVNWPLFGTGRHSPVTMPFDYPLPKPPGVHDSGVDEETCADYMVRYLVLALCSGMVERVYWWRLVARGYGLVDRNDSGTLRKRPAYFALQHLVRVLGIAEVLAAEWPTDVRDNCGEYRILLERQDGERVMLCWRHGASGAFPEMVKGKFYQDCYGKELDNRPARLHGSPVYVRHCILAEREGQ